MRAKLAALIIASFSIFAAAWSTPINAAAEQTYWTAVRPDPVRAAPIDYVALARALNPYGLTDELRTEWERVAACETGGNWSAEGSIYSGGLGFLNATWLAYGGGQFASSAGQASEDQQIVVARRVVGDAVPDQYGCTGGW